MIFYRGLPLKKYMTKAEYEKIFAENKELKAASLGSLVKNIDAPLHAVIVFNPNSGEVPGIVSFSCPEEIKNPVLKDRGSSVAVQKVGDVYIFAAAGVPSKGYKTYILEDGEENAEKVPEASMNVSVKHMENVWFAIDYNEKGQFAKIYDKAAKRQVLKEGKAGNVIISYEDRPHNYDAWDVNNYYTEKSWEIDDVSSMEVTEDGPVRACVRIERKYLDSVIVQEIYLYHDIPRIDIRNVIDWREHQIFVKDYFPVDVHANEATFDIQYGNVKRPTHANTSWDFAKFEVCHHKWMDVSEDGYGVSFLNDCKFGVSVRGSEVGLSMLKSAIHPNPEADKEHHEFTYSVYPHTENWTDANTVAQAYELNNPMTAVVKENEGGNLADEYSLFKVDRDNVVIETVKKAENGEELIVRLYECYNRRTNVTLICGEEIADAVECNLLEEDEKQVSFADNTVSLLIRPYEIKTLKIKLK